MTKRSNLFITIGNWRQKKEKESLVDKEELWFLKDLKTKKYYSLLGMEPNQFRKKDLERANYFCYGNNFLGYPIVDENLKSNNSDFKNQQKIKFRRKFQFVSIFDYVKELKNN
tara:strand:+ start:1353 stop:1691 length:339 start_codon:yes stop_codon:yes gene_type:complete